MVNVRWQYFSAEMPRIPHSHETRLETPDLSDEGIDHSLRLGAHLTSVMSGLPFSTI